MHTRPCLRNGSKKTPKLQRPNSQKPAVSHSSPKDPDMLRMDRCGLKTWQRTSRCLAIAQRIRCGRACVSARVGGCVGGCQASANPLLSAANARHALHRKRIISYITPPPHTKAPRHGFAYFAGRDRALRPALVFRTRPRSFFSSASFDHSNLWLKLFQGCSRVKEY